MDRIQSTAAAVLFLAGKGALSQVPVTTAPTQSQRGGGTDGETSAIFAVVGVLYGIAFLLFLFTSIVVLHRHYNNANNSRTDGKNSKRSRVGSDASQKRLLDAEIHPSTTALSLDVSGQEPPATVVENLELSVESLASLISANSLGEDIIIDRAKLTSPPTPKEVVKIQVERITIHVRDAPATSQSSGNQAEEIKERSSQPYVDFKPQPYQVVTRFNMQVEPAPVASSSPNLRNESFGTLDEVSETSRVGSRNPSMPNSRITTLNKAEQGKQLLDQQATNLRELGNELESMGEDIGPGMVQSLSYDGRIWESYDPELNKTPEAVPKSLPSHGYENVDLKGKPVQREQKREQPEADDLINCNNPDYDERIPFQVLRDLDKEPAEGHVMKKRVSRKVQDGDSPAGAAGEAEMYEDQSNQGTLDRIDRNTSEDPPVSHQKRSAIDNVGLDVLLFHSPLSELEDEITVSESFVDFSFLQSMESSEPVELDRSNVDDDLEQLGTSMDTLAHLRKKQKKKPTKQPSLVNMTRDIPSAMDIFSGQLEQYLDEPVFQKPAEPDQSPDAIDGDDGNLQRKNSLFFNPTYLPKTQDEQAPLHE